MFCMKDLSNNKIVFIRDICLHQNFHNTIYDITSYICLNILIIFEKEHLL